MALGALIDVFGKLPRRGDALRRLADETFDVAVVGGGITGAGIALDAASRGLRTALIEKDDFAAGASGKSSKLIHGGLRYLEMGDFFLVRQALLERSLLRRLIPRLVRPTPFVFPIFEGGRGAGEIGIGLTLYDAFARMTWSQSAGNAGSEFPVHRRLTARETAAALPGVRRAGLRAGFVYYDAVTDDARLTVEILKAAAGLGSVIANRCRTTEMLRRDGKIVGLRVKAQGGATPEEFDIRARRVVLAVGAWASEWRPPGAGGGLRPSKGAHIVVPAGRVPIETVAFIPSRDFHRPLFVIPWQGATLIGTTDTEYAGPPDAVCADEADVAYILDEINGRLPGLALRESDIVSRFAGLRPLADQGAAGPTTAVSREHVVRTDPDGVVTITGGKLTTWRIMARDVVDAVVRSWDGNPEALESGPCVTDRIRPAPIPSAARRTSAEPGLALATGTAEHIWSAYGGSAGEVMELIRGEPSLGRPLAEGFPHCRAEAVYAARAEMAATADDFLFRRSALGRVAGDAHELRSEVESLMTLKG